MYKNTHLYKIFHIQLLYSSKKQQRTLYFQTAINLEINQTYQGNAGISINANFTIFQTRKFCSLHFSRNRCVILWYLSSPNKVDVRQSCTSLEMLYIASGNEILLKASFSLSYDFLMTWYSICAFFAQYNIYI